jgi:polyisoprenoid-binding protein YceI
MRAAIASLACGAALAVGVAHADPIIADKSEIAFTTKQMGVNFDGRFRKFSGDVVFKPAALEASKAEIDVDLASVDLASADTDSEAKGPLWFNTAKFPVAHFSSTAVRKVGENRYAVTGKLSLKGIAREYVVPITLKNDAAGNRVAEGTFAVKRLDHKVGEGEWADTDTVANDVVVRLRLVLPPGG